MNSEDRDFLENMWKNFPIKDADREIIRRAFRDETKKLNSPTYEEIDQFLDDKFREMDE